MGYWFSIDKGANTETILDKVAMSVSVADQIKQIRDALEINTETAKIDYDDLRSIPDIWTTHRIYDMMLFGPEDGAGADVVLKKYKEAVIKNWRAIMAVLLIGKSFYGLTIEKMEITPDIMQDQRGRLGENRDFMRSIFDARPRSIVWRDQRAPYNPDVVAVYYLRKGNKMLPIAVSSPTTLAVPTADSWKHLYGLVDWIDEKTDSEGNKKYFVPDEFLEKLDYPKALALSEALQAESELPPDIIDQRKAAVLTALLGAYLNDTVLIDAREPINVHALLKETLYFFSGEIKTTTPDETDPVIGGIDKSCYYIDTTQHGADDDRYYNYYYLPMPITELCLNLIKQNVVTYSIQPNLERGLLKSVFVAITPTSADDTRRITREYGTEYALEKIRLNEQISTVAIWPRQEISGWSPYYAFRYDVAQHVETNSESGIDNKISGDRFVLEPPKPYINFDISGNNSQLHRYYKIDTFPEFWSFRKKTASVEDTVGFIRSTREKIAEANLNSIYSLAIDFGTSSTMLYRASSSIEKSEIVAGSAFWSAPICNPERHQNDQLVNCFIPAAPPRQIGMPCQTLLVVTKGQGSAAPDVLFGRWVFFRSIANEKRAQLNIEKKEIKTNLKWDAADPTDTQLFLREIVYLATLDARTHNCGTLKIIASYPGSMLEAKVAGFFRTLDEIGTELTSKTGVEIKPVRKVTESLAVAKGIRAKTRFGLNFCSIDIGGGTSDIFLCYKPSGENTEWQGVGSSMKIGSRDIFLDCFLLNRRLIQDIFDAGANIDMVKNLQIQFKTMNPANNSKKSIIEAADLATVENLSVSQYHSLIESLLEFNVDVDGRYYSAANSLMSISAKDNKLSIVNMRIRIAYYVAAITYYAGMLARIQDSTGSTLRIEQLEIRFVGNGSKAINWIGEDTKAIREFIKTMFQAGMKQPEKPKEVTFSSNPKHEVAFGALVDDVRLDGIQQDNIIIAGERFIERGSSQKEATSVMPQLATGARFRPEHTELKSFLETFNESILDIIPNIEHCVQYEYRDCEKEGFTDKVEGMMEDLVQKNQEKKPFFLMEVEIVDPFYELLRDLKAKRG